MIAMLLRLIGIVAAIAIAAVQPAMGQHAALDQIYGEGVHAFFAGEHDHAVNALTAAIDGGFNDARAYYFRGLAHCRMGNGVQGEEDFEQGAALESEEPDVTPAVSRAIQRVQGQTRLKLEFYRTKARLAALQTQRARDEERYGRERAQERRALTKQPDKTATPEEGLFDEKVAPKKAEEKPPAPGIEEAPDTKPEPKPADATDPFGDEPKAAETPAVKEEVPAAKEEMPAEEAAPKIEAPATEKPADKKA
jgi:hypothetical protein